MINRTVIGISILCAVLLVSLVIVSVHFSAIISSKDTESSRLNSQVGSLNSDIASLNAQLSSKDVKIDELSNQVDLLTNQTVELTGKIANLTSSPKLNTTEVWLDDEAATLQSGETATWNRTIEYPGYITINKIGGGSTKVGGETYVQVTYSSGPVYYNQKYIIGKSMPIFGGLNFPVLPTSNLEVKVGYYNPENATSDIRITVSYVH